MEVKVEAVVFADLRGVTGTTKFTQAVATTSTTFPITSRLLVAHSVLVVISSTWSRRWMIAAARVCMHCTSHRSRSKYSPPGTCRYAPTSREGRLLDYCYTSVLRIVRHGRDALSCVGHKAVSMMTQMAACHAFQR